MKTLPLLVFAAVFAIILSAPAAQAFTFEKNASGDSLVNGLAAGANPYGDSDEKLAPGRDASGFDNNGTSVYRQGDMSLQFGRPRSFNEEFNPNRLYDPLRR